MAMFSRTWVFLALLVVAACGSSSVGSAAGGVDATGAVVTTTSEPAPTTTELEMGLVPLIGGGQFDLGSIEGIDTVLWFWAPW